MSTKKDEELLQLWEGMFGNASVVNWSNYSVTYQMFMERVKSYTTQKTLEAQKAAVLNVIAIWNVCSDDDTFNALLQRDYPWLKNFKQKETDDE